MYITKSQEETQELGRKLALRSRGGDAVLLYGDLGAGKTQFVKGLAEGLGVRAVIKSPTYQYVNKYPILKDYKIKRLQDYSCFYHYDLYRFDDAAAADGLGMEEVFSDKTAISAVEWAERMGEELPEQYVLVSIMNDALGITNGNRREVFIEFVRPTAVTEDLVDGFYEKWHTPMNVRRHCAIVTEVAMEVASEFVAKGEIVDINLLRTACLLHDVARVTDFNDFKRKNYPDISDGMWERWLILRKKYAGEHHADIAYEYFKDKGYFDTAELIRVHKSANIVLDPKAYDTIEKKIIYYADKRVKHDEIVDLKERFRDGRERYGKFDSIEDRELFDEVEKRTYELERELI